MFDYSYNIYVFLLLKESYSLGLVSHEAWEKFIGDLTEKILKSVHKETIEEE